MMNQIVRFILIIASVIFIKSVVNRRKRDSSLLEETQDLYVIKLSKLYFFVGLFSFIFYFIILVKLINSNEVTQWWSYTIILSLFVASLCIITATLNWCIILENDFFVYRTFFSNTYSYKYDDVKGCVIRQNIIILNTKNKRFYIDPNSIGIENFICLINNKTYKC